MYAMESMKEMMLMTKEEKSNTKKGSFIFYCPSLMGHVIAAAGGFVGEFICRSLSLSLHSDRIIMIIFNLIFNKFEPNGKSNRIKNCKWSRREMSEPMTKFNCKRKKKKKRRREYGKINSIFAWLTLWYFNIIIIHIKGKHGVIGRFYAHYYCTLRRRANSMYTMLCCVWVPRGLFSLLYEIPQIVELAAWPLFK